MTNDLVALQKVKVESINWYWKSRLPIGKFVVFDGNPGTAKSVLSLDIAAKLSSGQPMPLSDEINDPVNVMILSAEDGLGDTIVPRLKAAGANLKRVSVLKAINGIPPLLTDDMAQIMKIVEDKGIGLMIVDVLPAYLNNINTDIRRSLYQITEMAGERKLTILGLRHLRKVVSKTAVYSGAGSMAVVGTARMGFMIAQHPTEPDKNIMAVTKANITKAPKSLEFRVKTSTKYDTAEIDWLNESDLTVADIIKPTDESIETIGGEAKDFLSEFLEEHGGNVDAKAAIAAGKEIGFALRTLQKARTDLGIQSKRIGSGGKSKYVWKW